MLSTLETVQRVAPSNWNTNINKMRPLVSRTKQNKDQIPISRLRIDIL